MELNAVLHDHWFDLDAIRRENDAVRIPISAAPRARQECSDMAYAEGFVGAWRWVPVLMLAALGACQSTQPSCADRLWPATPEGVEEPAAFGAALESVLRAQCTCTFDADSRALFPLGVDGRGSWEGVKDVCIRRFDVASVSPGSDEFVSIYLAGRWNGRRHGRPVYVMVSHYVDGSWVFSWPAETGETADALSR